MRIENAFEIRLNTDTALRHLLHDCIYLLEASMFLTAICCYKTGVAASDTLDGKQSHITNVEPINNAVDKEVTIDFTDDGYSVVFKFYDAFRSALLNTIFTHLALLASSNYFLDVSHNLKCDFEDLFACNYNTHTTFGLQWTWAKFSNLVNDDQHIATGKGGVSFMFVCVSSHKSITCEVTRGENFQVPLKFRVLLTATAKGNCCVFEFNPCLGCMTC